ncbi:MAG: hypothetical protein AAF960_29180 [Bacteroidota bacterium]
MYNYKSILLIGFIALLNFSFLTNKIINKRLAKYEAVTTFNEELCQLYNEGHNLTLVTPEGRELVNPNKEDLRTLSSEMFQQNRIRVTLMGRSDNNLCSTELVVMGNSGQIVGNYTVNSCSSYGWIFFTESDCFDIALFHDAGLEAPYGNSVNGSVDWTFQFNGQSRVSGTYMDMGAANMFKVASPCYRFAEDAPMMVSDEAKTSARRRQPLGM